MAYYFLLDKLPLPITPGALNISTPTLNATKILINDGEINIPKGDGLREISFEFLIPSVQQYPFANYQLGSYTATAMIPLLRAMKAEAAPISFIVVRLSPKGKFEYFTAIRCTIEEMEFKEDAEEYGLDTMCSIMLKEFCPYATKRIKVEESSDGKPGSKTAKVTKTRDTSSKVKSSNVKPQNGETVVSAAKKNGDDLVDLSKHNNIHITSADSMGTVSKGLDITDKVDFSKYTQSTFEGIDSAGNVVIGGVQSGEVHSMGDTLILGSPPVKTYTSPVKTYKSSSGVIQKITSQGFDWTNIASGI